MTQPTPQPVSNQTQPSPAAQTPPGIINDLQEQVSPAASQSMIINDLPPPPAPPPGQQMIINDLPSVPTGTEENQQKIVNDLRYADASSNQQVVGNDVAFTDLMKGLEALTRGEIPANTPPQSTPNPPSPQPEMNPQPQPTPEQQQASPAPAAQPSQPVSQQPQPLDSGTARPGPLPQPMVINTPQPLVKPRREEMGMPRLQPEQPAVNQVVKRPEARPAGLSVKVVEKNPGTLPKSDKNLASVPGKPNAAWSRNPDEWQAKYAGRTMTPSLAVCVALSVVIVYLSLRFLPSDVLPTVLLAGLGFIWVMQLVRWGYRVACFKYRITKEHLHLHRGLLYGKPVQVPLSQVLKVSVSANLLEKMLGVGKVVVEVKDGKPGPLELEGVRQPQELVQKIEQIK